MQVMRVADHNIRTLSTSAHTFGRTLRTTTVSGKLDALAPLLLRFCRCTLVLTCRPAGHEAAASLALPGHVKQLQLVLTIYKRTDG